MLVAFFIVAPHLPAPPRGIRPPPTAEIFVHWDGGWFRTIATEGYSYARDGHEHAVAFFPLYPLIVAVVMRLGITVEAAAPLASNVFFLAMLFVVFDWVRGRHGVVCARWTIGTLAALPTSLFGTVAYSEPLFMLVSALALRDFERGRPLRAGMWAALASATRFAGVGLAFGFAIETLVRRRPLRYWLGVAIAPLGAAAYARYLGARFGDPLAFVHVEAAWRARLGFTPDLWLDVIDHGMVGHWHWAIELAFVVAAIWYVPRRARFGPTGLAIAAFATVLVQGRLWGLENNLKLLFIGVAGYAIVRFHERFTIAQLAYAGASLALIAAAGTPYSAERFAYALVPTSIGLAFLWQRVPPLGYATLGLGACELVVWSIMFAQRLFVA